MKVLWFEISQPCNYNNSSKTPIAGWQDALQDYISKQKEIELGIAFPCKKDNGVKIIDNVTYYPIKVKYNLIEKITTYLTHKTSRNKLIPIALKVIEDYKPDIIHVFGSEHCWGQVVKYTKIPVVIHLQGSIPPYYDALYPPGYNIYNELFSNGLNIVKSIKSICTHFKMKTWKEQEIITLQSVNYYMGRTDWDKSIVNYFNPNAKYYYCSEALRPTFVSNKTKWTPKNNKTIKLISTGCSTYWKGMDTIIKTAKLLKDKNIDFEWTIIGKMHIKECIEHKERLLFSNLNFKLYGYLDATEVKNKLLDADIYIHAAYIDNSPNSICEAQYLGVPIIATYVGGIPSLLENNKDGILIPANEPYILAYNIIKLASDIKKQKYYSENSFLKAHTRHNSSNIISDLLCCYTDIINHNLNK